MGRYLSGQYDFLGAGCCTAWNIMMGRPAKPILQRFAEQIELGPIPEHCPQLGPCWNWTGAKTDQGYGLIGERLGLYKKRTVLAHRFSYETFIGELGFSPSDKLTPQAIVCDHCCKNTSCVNPNHLRLLTHLANSADNWVANEKRAVTHCPEGHPYDEHNTFDRPLPAGGVGRGCAACAGVSNRANARYRRLIKKGIHTTYQEQLAIAKTVTFKRYKPRQSKPGAAVGTAAPSQ